jgi:hypothetical protein
MSVSVLLLGFMIGMRHALDADHVAAVASLATRSQSISDTVRQGAFWGLGHTATLFLFGTVVLTLDAVISERLAHGLEFLVGLMLIVLGVDVLRRMIKDRIHFHVHRHVNGALHFHAHSHAGEKGHGPDHHCHDHSRDFPLRALFVGSMHGMAGSAALILLTLQAVETPMQGLLYIALFGAGSILSMLGLSAVIAVPLRLSGMGQRLTWLHMGFQATIGIVTMAMGTMLAYQIGVIDGFFVQ